MMRNLVAPRALSATASILALAVAAFPVAASAQTENQQVEAQQAAQQNCTTGTEQEQADCRANSSGVIAGSTAGTSEGEMIVVTGSRIARAGFDTAQPATVLGSTDIEARGFTTLGDALNELPAFGDPGSSPLGDQQSSFGPGQSFVNFLGLGSQRTLTLVNGRRFVGGNSSSIFGSAASGSQVDLNVIPTLLIDRVETIATGGAPIYGADAISGTVNVILKRNFEGISIDAENRISSRGDFDSRRIRALAGWNFGGGRGNLTISGEYQKSGGLVFNDRASTREGLQYGDPPPGSPYRNGIYPDARLAIISEFGIPLPDDFVPLDPNPYPATVGSISSIYQSYGVDPADADFFADLLLGGRTEVSQAETLGFLFGEPAGFTDAQGRPLRFDKTGNLVPIDFGRSIDTVSQDIRTFVTGGNGFQFSSVSNLITPLERYSGIGLFNYQLTDNLRVFGEGWYSVSQGKNLIAQPAYNSLLFASSNPLAGNLQFSVDNPFLSDQARDIIQAQSFGDTFFLARANTDISSRTATGKTEVIRFVGGFDGTFQLNNNEFNWEIFGNYGRSKTTGRNPELIEQNFLNAIDAVRDSSGAIVCRPGYVSSPFPTESANCAPLNLFGSGNASQAAIDYITGISTPSSLNEQKDFVASLSGNLFDLPGGPLGVALGYEHREESQNFDPGALLFGADDPDPTTDADGDGIADNDRVSYTRDATVLPVKGGYNTEEVFGELRVPVISPSMNIPLIRMLELQGALRYVDNSISGGDFTWTVGARWQPIRDITFRGNYTVSIRAPAVTEVFAPSSPVFFTIQDPCEEGRLGAGADPATRQANCAAAGLPPDFSSSTDNATLSGAFVGNPNLKNEQAKSFTFGAVLRPRFIPGLTVSVDYVRIKLRDAISGLTATQIADFCYDSPDYPNNQYCDRITRDNRPTVNGNPNPSYQDIIFVQTTNFNAARLDYGGILSDIDYRTKTPFLGKDSEIGIGASYQYIDKLQQQADATSLPTIIRGLTGYAKHQAQVRLNYGNGPLSMQVSADYIGSAYQAITTNPLLIPHNKIPAVTYFNSYIAFDVADRFQFRIIVNNLFDTDVPRNGILGGGIASYIEGVLGRFYSVGATVKF